MESLRATSGAARNILKRYHARFRYKRTRRAGRRVFRPVIDSVNLASSAREARAVGGQVRSFSGVVSTIQAEEEDEGVLTFVRCDGFPAQRNMSTR